jgi:hypothetical protein
MSAPVGHIRSNPDPDATGRSQLFGDGRVEWRSISINNEDNLPSGSGNDFREEDWNGPGSGWLDENDMCAPGTTVALFSKLCLSAWVPRSNPGLNALPS